ncbi:MAG: hypothetical protein M3162_02240 [Thermoproteota archaeon]|nr:hypothetical protein [Thermoproteota archaeon]
MANKTYSKNSQSPELQAFIVEPILVACMDDAAMDDIAKEVGKVIPSPFPILKDYLFFLIEYGLVSYNGQKRLFSMDDGGWEMMHLLRRQKRINGIDSKDIVITLE